MTFRATAIKVIAIVIIIAIIIVVIFGCCAIWEKFFTQKLIPTIPSNVTWITNPQNTSVQENYKATYDLFDSHFKQLISLFTLFGIVVPIATYFLQIKSLKDERKRINKIRKKAKDSEKAAKRAQEIADKSIKLLEEKKYDDINTFRGAFEYLEKMTYYQVNPKTILYWVDINIFCIEFLAQLEQKDRCIAKIDEIKKKIDGFKSQEQLPPQKNLPITKISVDKIRSCLGDDKNLFDLLCYEVYDNYPYKCSVKINP